MSSVYSTAMLTLAATASQSPRDGLLHPLQSARCVPVDDDMAMVRMQTHTDVDSASEPLNTRAWTLPEAILSQRMACFGSEQFLWRCSSRCATEDGFEDRVPMNTEGLYRAPLSAMRRPDETRQLYLKQWDKLSAIAGLADMCAKQTGFQYVAGLWVEDIGAGLMWQATSPGATRGHSPFPSWSWASTEGAILTQDFTEADTSMIEVLKVNRDLNEYTSATLCASTRLHVRGATIRLMIGKQSLTQPLRYHLCKGNEIFGEAFFDEASTGNFGEACGVLCLQVYLARTPDDKQECFALLLVTDVVGTGSLGTEVFKRFGIGVIWPVAKYSDGSESGTRPSHGASIANKVLERGSLRIIGKC